MLQILYIYFGKLICLIPGGSNICQIIINFVFNISSSINIQGLIYNVDRSNDSVKDER